RVQGRERSGAVRADGAGRRRAPRPGGGGLSRPEPALRPRPPRRAGGRAGGTGRSRRGRRPAPPAGHRPGPVALRPSLLRPGRPRPLALPPRDRQRRRPPRRLRRPDHPHGSGRQPPGLNRARCHAGTVSVRDQPPPGIGTGAGTGRDGFWIGFGTGGWLPLSAWATPASEPMTASEPITDPSTTRRHVVLNDLISVTPPLQFPLRTYVPFIPKVPGALI